MSTTDPLSTHTAQTRPSPEGDVFSPPLRRKTNRQYKFIRSIGFGGMKAVLLVEDRDTGREIAMAMMALRTLAPRMAAMTTHISSMGTQENTSMMRMMMLSTLPPK